MIDKAKNIWSDIKIKIKSVLHSRISTEKLARSISIGTFVALTPTFGLQMPIVGLIWSILKFFKKWRFNLAIGLSMTWITNYFTVIPYYFTCYYTGIWLGDNIFRFKSPISYERFSDLWQRVLDAGFWDSFKELAFLMLRIGKPLFLGSILYAIIGSIIIYRATYYFVMRHRKRTSRTKILQEPAIKLEAKDDVLGR